MSKKQTIFTIISCFGIYRDNPVFKCFSIKKHVTLDGNDPIILDCIKKASEIMEVGKVTVIWEYYIIDKKCAKKTQKKIPAKSKRGTVKRLKPRSSQK